MMYKCLSVVRLRLITFVGNFFLQVFLVTGKHLPLNEYWFFLDSMKSIFLLS